MTLYCQHAQRLRLVRPGRPETESERPRDAVSGAYQDAPGGTQVDIPADVTGFDLGFALRLGTIVPLPCPDHPREPPKPATSREGR